MKRIIVFATIFLMLFGVNTDKTFAEKYKATRVYSDEMIDIGEGSYLVPIKITNNPGLMGFKITVSYGDGVTINSVSRGSVTKKGNLIDNHQKFSGEKYFDVIWNYTKEIRTDGELFIIGLSIDTDYAGKILLDIDYSSPDTFDEQYGNVILECSNVVLREKNDSQGDMISSHEKTTKIKEADTNDNNLSAKDNAQEKTKNNQRENSNESASEKASKQPDNKAVENVKLNKKYKNNKYINNAIEENRTGKVYNRLSGDTFVKAVDQTLKEQGYNSIDDIPNEKQKIFAESVLNRLGVNDTEINVKDEADSDLFEHIGRTYKEQKKELNNKNKEINDKISENKEKNNKKSNSTVIIIITIVVLFTGILSLIYFSKKGKDKKNEKE